MKENLSHVLTSIGVKGGASPGAIMQDNDGNKFVVKLGLPISSGPYGINCMEDLDSLTRNMSKKSCEEKIFFNIANAIGGDAYQLPEVELVKIKPQQYKLISGVEVGSNSRSVNSTLKHKIKIGLSEDLNAEEILDKINNTPITHFASKIIPNYQDVGTYYNYHEDKAISSSHKNNPNAAIPEEPGGLGALYALSCCLGNNDSIGANGGNVGFNPLTNKIIVVDGGNSNFNPNFISHFIPVADSNKSWLSFTDDLSVNAQKEACDTFIKFASLNSAQLRALITDNEKVTSILGESFINNRIEKIKSLQAKVVEEFYQDMMNNNCHITKQVENLHHTREHKSTSQKIEYYDKENEFHTPNLTLPTKKKTPLNTLSLSINIENSSSAPQVDEEPINIPIRTLADSPVIKEISKKMNVINVKKCENSSLVIAKKKRVLEPTQKSY